MSGLAPPLTDERELLLAYLAQQRQGARNAAHGLTDEQARRTPVSSALSVGGLDQAGHGVLMNTPGCSTRRRS